MIGSVGIGVPVFNGEDFLADCLESIAAQDYEQWSVLISDNASTDATPEICREFVRRDDRFRYVRQPVNLGAAGNYNYVMDNSVGDLYKMAAHDDCLAPGFLRLCVEALDAHPDAVLSFPGTRYIDPDGAHIGDYEDPLVWNNANSPAGRLRDLFVPEARSYLRLCYPVMGVMRRSAALRTRGIQTFQAADAAMLVELALQGDFAEVREPLYLKRLHDNTSMRANATSEDFALWYDPKNAGLDPLPWTRLARSHFSAPWRIDLSFAERAACTVEVTRWFYRERHWRMVGSELRSSARARLHTGCRELPPEPVVPDL